MAGPAIEKPKKVIILDTPAMKAELVWNPSFRGKWQGRYSAAQRFVDSEVLRRCEPFVPFLTGTLVRSGPLGTSIGSGTVSWITPYAHRQYYSAREPGSETGPLRGPHWFLRMKQVHGAGIVAGARRLAGGGGR